MEIVKGNEKKAIAILKNLENENGFLTPMQYCYLGIATKDIALIEKSIELFECAGNRFYCKFPKKLLEDFIKNGIVYEGGVK